jgi:hypothetical protein
VTKNTCDILKSALIRYHRYLQLEQDAGLQAKDARRDEHPKNMPPGTEHALPDRNSSDLRGNLRALEVELTEPCEDIPHASMKENCEEQLALQATVKK